MKRLRWSLAAAADLDEIAAYLHLNHPGFAQATILRIYDATKRLKRFPEFGREGRLPGTRELVLAPLPYILIYSVSADAIHILRILHTSRERP